METLDYEQRTKQIITMRESGKSYQDIGYKFDICLERVREILKRDRPDLCGWRYPYRGGFLFRNNGRTNVKHEAALPNR